jgi:outer membrane lipoprotein-sorting protein
MISLMFALGEALVCQPSGDPKAEALLASMRRAYSSAKTADFTVKTVMLRQKKEHTVQSDVIFAQPRKFFAAMKGWPGAHSGETVYFRCDGDRMSVEGGADEPVKMTFAPDEVLGILPSNLETICFWDWERQLSTSSTGNMKSSKFKILENQEWNGKNWLVLEETAPEQRVFVRYWIDSKTKYIWRTRTMSLDQATTFADCVLLRLAVNRKVDEKKFEIKA